MLLSIIIPVYNVASYLRECVVSAVNFPVPDKEIILVDDGSTDGSAALCDELQRDYSIHNCKIKVIHQKNNGVSVARNVGIKASKGDWLWFVDSDDTISLNITLDEKLLQQSNFVVTGFSWSENNKVSSFGAFAGEVPYNLWRCWFRSAIVKRLKVNFVKGRRYAEDQEFILNYLLESEKEYDVFNKTYPIDFPVYSYTVRPGSAMTKSGVKWKKIVDIAKVDLLFAYHALISGNIMRKWVLSEMKRMTKALWIVIIR